MRKSGFVLVLVSFCPLAFGQLDSNSITVSVSNTANLQPDQVVFSVNVQSGLNTGLDDVLAALQGSGITAANLSSVGTQILGGSRVPNVALEWLFNFTAPLTNTKSAIATLTTLQQNVSQNSGLTLSFSIAGTQVSQQLAQSQTCSLPGLITAATTQAQNLAAASGLTLGSILALSSSTANFVPGLYATPPTCAITVKFNVTRY